MIQVCFPLYPKINAKKYAIKTKSKRWLFTCPKVHMSEGSHVRRSTCPNVHLSEGPLVRRSEGFVIRGNALINNLFVWLKNINPTPNQLPDPPPTNWKRIPQVFSQVCIMTHVILTTNGVFYPVFSNKGWNKLMTKKNIFQIFVYTHIVIFCRRDIKSYPLEIKLKRVNVNQIRDALSFQTLLSGWKGSSPTTQFCARIAFCHLQ